MNFKNLFDYGSQLKRDLTKHLPDLDVEEIDSDIEGIIGQCLYDIENTDNVDGLVTVGYLDGFSITNKFKSVGEDVIVEYTINC